MYDDLANRALDVEPVQQYAARLNVPSVDIRDGITVREGAAIALWYNADLRIARLEAERAGVLAGTAGRWDDPGLEIANGVKWFDGPMDAGWIGGGSLALTLPLSGRPWAERKARNSEHQVALLALARDEWRTLASLRELWITWSELVEARDLLDAHLDLLDTFARTTQDLARAGEVDFATSRLFTLEDIRKRALRENVALREAQARSELHYLMGLVAEAPVTLLSSLSTHELPTGTERALRDAALHHPDVLLAQAEYDAAESRLRVELRKQYPDLTLSPGFDAEPGETAFVLGFGFPLPIWNANRQGIAEAVAERKLARARMERELLRAETEIARSNVALNANRARREMLVNDAAPEVDVLITTSTELLRAGEADFGVLFQALTQTYEVKTEILSATADEQRARVNQAALRTPFWTFESENGESK